MHGVDERRQRQDLVGLQLADEVDVHALAYLCRQGGNLARHLLLAVLPDVRHTELAQCFDVRAREELRDHDQGDVFSAAAAGPACSSDALMDLVKIGGELPES